jgi:hypothetical protein
MAIPIKYINELEPNELSRSLGRLITVDDSFYLQYKTQKVKVKLTLVQHYKPSLFYYCIGILKDEIFEVSIIKELEAFDYFVFEQVLDAKRNFLQTYV